MLASATRLESSTATAMSWPALWASPPSTEVATVEKAPLRTASAMTAQDSRPPAREKTNICRLANSSVEAMTLMNMRKRPAFAPRRSSAMRITTLPRPSFTPGTVTGRGMSSSR